MEKGGSVMRKINPKIELENLLDEAFDFIYTNDCTDCHNLGYHCGLGCFDAELEAELNGEY